MKGVMMNIDPSKCWNGSMLAVSVNDAIKGMQLVEEEGKKIEEQKAKSQTLNANLGVEKEFRAEKRLLDLKA